jgi:hypothetical protein
MIRVNWANQKQSSANKNAGKVDVVNSPDVQIVMAQVRFSFQLIN